MRRAARKDLNQNEIAEHLKNHGWAIADTSRLGFGFPDIVASKGGYFTAVVECKDGSKPPSDRRLTEAEQKFRKNWTGPYVLAVSPEDALTQLEALYSRTLYE